VPTNFLHTPIEYLNGVGPARAKLLKAELGIQSYGDLANFFPNRYIDKTKYYKINELVAESSHVQVIGVITHLKSVGNGKSSRLVWCA